MHSVFASVGARLTSSVEIFRVNCDFCIQILSGGAGCLLQNMAQNFYSKPKRPWAHVSGKARLYLRVQLSSGKKAEA